MPQDEKAARADVVVVNDGDLEVLAQRAVAAVGTGASPLAPATDRC